MNNFIRFLHRLEAEVEGEASVSFETTSADHPAVAGRIQIRSVVRLDRRHGVNRRFGLDHILSFYELEMVRTGEEAYLDGLAVRLVAQFNGNVAAEREKLKEGASAADAP